MKPFLFLISILTVCQPAQTETKQESPPPMSNVQESAAIVYNKCAIAADGGSMMLVIRDAAGKETVYFRNFSLAAENTEAYGQISDDSGHKLNTDEQNRLVARLNGLKAACAPDCTSFVDEFINKGR